MCVIISSPDKKHRPNLATLRACAKSNPHGSGVAWIEQGRVHFVKGLSPDGISELLCLVDGPTVIHFRYATVGDKCNALCHPFPVTEEATPSVYGNAKRVLFHNGTWAGWETFLAENDIALDGPVSDSRVIALGVYLGGRSFLKSDEVKAAGRFVLFSAKSGAELFGKWETLHEVSFSNLNWQRHFKQAELNLATPAPALTKPAKPANKLHCSAAQASRIADAMACYGD